MRRRKMITAAKRDLGVLWKRFSRSSGRIAVACLVIMILAVLTQSFTPYMIESDPGLRWGDTSAQGGRIQLHVQPAELDLKSEILRTLWFQLSIYTLDSQPFNALVIWPGDFFPFTAYPPKSDNGTYDYQNIQRTAFWELVTRPEKGGEPWPWQLQRTGEYPWDQYSYVLLFAFNRTVGISGVSTYVTLSPTLADGWKVTQSFEPLSGFPSFQDTLLSIGFSQQDFSGQERRLPAYLDDYVDFYVLKITFVRQSFEMLRGAFAFWMPAIFLLGLLIIAFGRIEALEKSEALTVFLGIPLAALPFILSALQVLPPRLSLVESFFYGEVAASIAFAAVALARVKT